jgi:hypothetical protein
MALHERLLPVRSKSLISSSALVSGKTAVFHKGIVDLVGGQGNGRDLSVSTGSAGCLLRERTFRG